MGDWLRDGLPEARHSRRHDVPSPWAPNSSGRCPLGLEALAGCARRDVTGVGEPADGVPHGLFEGPSTDPELIDRRGVVDAGIGGDEPGTLHRVREERPAGAIAELE